MNFLSLNSDPMVHSVLLWELLAERTSNQSIAHKEMPTEREHCAFVCSQPYLTWQIIEVDGTLVGACHITKNHEIGIGILKRHQGKGYGKKAVRMLMDTHPGALKANINPANAVSIHLFESLGFQQIQVTYELPDQP